MFSPHLPSNTHDRPRFSDVPAVVWFAGGFSAAAVAGFVLVLILLLREIMR